MMWKSVMAFAGVAALAMGVMAEDVRSPQQESGQQNMQNEGAGGTSGSGGMADEQEATSTNPDRAFAAVLVSHARLEQQISNLVAQKATNPQIKQLAQEIASDHQQISQKVQQAAQKAGITVHPDRMLPRDQAILSHMQRLPVSTLERNYVFYEAGSNQTHQLMSQWASKNATKPEIKQAAQEVYNKLQERGKTIQQLAQSEVSGSTGVGGSSGGSGSSGK